VCRYPWSRWPGCYAQAWGNSGAGEEGPCTCAHAWGSAGAGEAGPCPRAHAWRSSGGGQQRTQGTRQRASLPRERRRRAGARILGRVTGSAASRHRRSSSGRIRRHPVAHRAPPAAARGETRGGGRRGRDGLGIWVGTNWGSGNSVGTFLQNVRVGKPRGATFFGFPSPIRLQSPQKKGLHPRSRFGCHPLVGLRLPQPVKPLQKPCQRGPKLSCLCSNTPIL
jgi:hypothetical protein